MSKDKPSKLQKSVTLCIPSSCINSSSCRSQQQATHIANQIARAAVHYQVTEIVIYDAAPDAVETAEQSNDQPKKIVFGDEPVDEEQSDASKKDGPSEDATNLALLLDYFVTPSYLRKAIYGTKLKTSLVYAKRLPRLPKLPILNHQNSRYLEGLTVPAKVEKKSKGSRKSKKQIQLESTTEFVNVGAKEMIKLDGQRVPLHSRVTVDLEQKKVVPAKDAYKNAGSVMNNGSGSFGYTVRIASSFGKVFVESQYKDGYSYTAYCPSEIFFNSDDASNTPALKPVTGDSLMGKDEYRLLLVFGKWTEIQRAVRDDKAELEVVDDATGLFDGMFNVNGNARVEDCVMISLAKLEGLPVF